MSAGEQTLLLFAGIAAVLLAASLIGFVLSRRYAASPVVGNLNARIKAWWVMVALIGLAFDLGKAGVIALFALASFAALREFLTLTRTRRGDHLALAAAFFVVLPLQYYLIWIDWYGLYSILIPVYIFLLLPVVAALRGDTAQFMRRIAEVQWGPDDLRLLRIPCAGAAGIADTRFRGSQAAADRLFDPRRAVERRAAICLGQAARPPPDRAQPVPLKNGRGVCWRRPQRNPAVCGAVVDTPFPPWQAALIALVINLMGFCGGLVMSAIKRDRGVKDWGQMIEGHGGMLDRLDSVVFAAPIFFHLTRYWWTM